MFMDEDRINKALDDMLSRRSELRLLIKNLKADLDAEELLCVNKEAYDVFSEKLRDTISSELQMTNCDEIGAAVTVAEVCQKVEQWKEKHGIGRKLQEAKDILQRITTLVSVSCEGEADCERILNMASVLLENESASPAKFLKAAEPYHVLVDVIEGNIALTRDKKKLINSIFGEDVLYSIEDNLFRFSNLKDAVEETGESKGTVEAEQATAVNNDGIKEGTEELPELETIQDKEAAQVIKDNLVKEKECAIKPEGKVLKQYFEVQDIRIPMHFFDNKAIQLEKDVKSTIKKFSTKKFLEDRRETRCCDLFDAIMEDLYLYGASIPGIYVSRASGNAKDKERAKGITEYIFDVLWKKGYIQKYILEPYGYYYFITERGFCIFTSEKAIKTINRTPWTGTYQNYVTEKITPSQAAARIALANIRCEGFPKGLAAKKIAEEAAIASDNWAYSIKNNDKIICLIWGSFSEQGKIDNNIYNLLAKVFESKFNNFVASGATREHAKRLAVAFLQYLKDNDKHIPEYIVLYSLEDKAYYAYEDLEPINLWDNVFIEGNLEKEKAEQVSDISHDMPDDTEETDFAPAPAEQSKKEDAEHFAGDGIVEDVSKEAPVEDDANQAFVTQADSSLNVKKAVQENTGTSCDDNEQSGEISNKQKWPLIAITKEEVVANLMGMMCKGKLYCAVSYLKVASVYNPDLADLYGQLSYAINNPMEFYLYSTQNLYEIFPDGYSKYSDYLRIACVLRVFFVNEKNADLHINTYYQNYVKNCDIVDRNTALSRVVYMIANFKIENKLGMDAFTEYHTQANMNYEKCVKQIQKKAKTCAEKIGINLKREKNFPRYFDTVKVIFQNDMLLEYVKTVASDDFYEDSDLQDIVSDYLFKNFIDKEADFFDGSIDVKKVGAYIDYHYEIAGRSQRCKEKSSKLVGPRRNGLMHLIMESLAVLCEGLNMVSVHSVDYNSVAYQNYNRQKQVLLNDIRLAIDAEQKMDYEDYCRSALVFTLEEIASRIEGTYSITKNKYFFIDFLRSDNITLDERFLPELNQSYDFIRDYSVLARISKHSEIAQLPTYQERIEDECDDDYGSLELLQQYMASVHEDYQQIVASEDDILRAENEVRNLYEDFMQGLELSQAYGQLDVTKENSLKDALQQIAQTGLEEALSGRNFHMYKKLLMACKEEIKREAQERGEQLKAEWKKSCNQLSQLPEEAAGKLEIEIERLLQEQNFTVVEDIMGRLQRGDMEGYLPTSDRVDYLNDFLSRYQMYYNIVSNPKYTLRALLQSHVNVHNQDTKYADMLLNRWLAPGKDIGSDRLKEFLDVLGLSVSDMETISINKLQKYYSVKLKNVEARLILKPKHIVADFGSKAIATAFRVIPLAANYNTAEKLFAFIKEHSNNASALFLVDAAMQLPERRKLARLLKTELFSSFVYGVIDRVVMTYLITKYRREHITEMLMDIIMPYCYYQPYSPNSSALAPEMFIGRNRELNMVKDPNGINLLYGGRQLGKSAVLDRVCRDIESDKSISNNRAVFIDINRKDYKETAIVIGKMLVSKNVLGPEYKHTQWDWQVLEEALIDRLNSEEKRINYLLLCIDEADTFIDSMKDIKYMPLEALKRVSNVGIGRFKFVLAGLHNVMRFNRSKSLSDNMVLTKLSSMTIKPFNSSEAWELLEKPLYTLGFRFSPEKQYLIAMIFANANYFPGLIQLYCSKLIEALRNKNTYGGYSDTKVPPYDINDGIIKKILSDKDFQQEVKAKFDITLDLEGNDNYYRLLALLMAWLYHEERRYDGYSAQDIMNVAKEAMTKKIVQLSLDELIGFLDELCELNIFRKTLDDKYLFNRYNFFQMMGDRDQVEKGLLEYMEE